jgi:hypothetical protein
MHLDTKGFKTVECTWELFTGKLPFILESNPANITNNVISMIIDWGDKPLRIRYRDFYYFSETRDGWDVAYWNDSSKEWYNENSIGRKLTFIRGNSKAVGEVFTETPNIVGYQEGIMIPEDLALESGLIQTPKMSTDDD